MLLSKRPIRTLMAAAIALAALPAMAGESPYSKAVFFGDSLTDAGYFRPLLDPGVQPVTGQFTTNPGWVWSQQVANYYGLNGGANGNGQKGDNYAVGGARVSVDEAGGLGAIPSLKSQAARYLAAMAARLTVTRCTPSGEAPMICSRPPVRRQAARPRPRCRASSAQRSRTRSHWWGH